MAYVMQELPPETLAGLRRFQARLDRGERPKLTDGVWVTLEAMSHQLAEAHRAIRDLQAAVPGTAPEPAVEPEVEAKPSRKAVALNLVGPITEKSVKPLIRAIENARGRKVKITIDSDGGDVAAANDLADAIRQHGDVATHAISDCHSAAVLVFSAGRTRSAMRSARFSVHRASLPGVSDPSEREAGVLDESTRLMARQLAKACGHKNARRFSAMMRSDEPVVLNNIEATELGLVQIVRRPRKAAA
jgi:ATP-dependent protease ClpP protease subunit